MRSTRAAAVAVATALAWSGTPATAANDPLRSLQWALDQIAAPDAWRRTTGKGVVVAVLGTGVDLAHPDLKAAIAPGGADLVSPGQPPQDDRGGGTIAAGIIAARRNTAGTVGVAPDARILPIRLTDTSTQYAPTIPYVEEFAEAYLVARGIRLAADRRAKVILLTSALLVTDEALDYDGRITVDVKDAIAYAWAKGAVVVAPAGNHGPTGCPYIGTKALCVGAVDKRGNPAPYTRPQRGSTAFVCGPGGSAQGWFTDNIDLTNEDVVAPVARGSTLSSDDKWPGYVWTSGTALAAAHVAGVAALLSARRMTNAAIVQRLQATATDVAPSGPDAFCGAGLVHAGRAAG